MSRPVTTGSADQSIRFWAYDSDGAAVTGEAYNSAGMAVSVVVRSAGRIISTTALTLVARSGVGVHTDSALTEVGNGEYVVDLPDSYSAIAERDISLTVASTAITGAVLVETLAVGFSVDVRNWTGLTIASGTIGTDNNTTQLHLPGLTFGDNELDNLMIVVYDVSEDEYHSNWINAWSAGGENTASLVLTLPFTPQASTDTYVVLSVRSNNKQLTAVQTSVNTIDDLLDTEVAALTTELGLVKDRVSYCLTVLVGACADAGTAAETYVHAIGGETFTVDFTGLDATGTRTTTTLSKV